MPIPLTKQINGKKFYKRGAFNSKEDARKEARLWRLKGKLARVLLVPEFGRNKVWTVYVHPK